METCRNYMFLTKVMQLLVKLKKAALSHAIT